MKRILWAFFLIPGLSFGEAGYSSANFLKIGLGARAAAMGDSYTAVSDDPTALYWNPAGLFQVTDTQISLTHAQWLQGVNDETLFLSHHLGNDGALGLGFTWLGVSTFLSTVENNSGGYAGLGTAANANDWALSLGYANSLGGILGNHLLHNTLLGLNANFVNQNENGPTGNAISFDAGMIQLFPKQHFSLGFDLVNIGTSIQDRSQPFLVKAGASWYEHLDLQPGDKLTLAADIDLHDDTGLQPRVGGEYALPLEKTLTGALRAGFRTTDQQYGFSFMTLGAGLAKNFDGVEAGLDYAYVPYGAIGPTHRFTLNLKLDSEESRLEADLNGPSRFILGARRTPLDLKAVAKAGVSEWQLDLTDLNGKPVRDFKGSGAVPPRVDWDLRDSSGRQVPAGSYVAVLRVDDLKNKWVQTKPVTISAQTAKVVKPLDWMISGDTIFATGSAEINELGREKFDALAREIQKYFKGSPIEIGGHTDNKPIRKETKLPYKDNFQLSQARALAVQEYLVKRGLDPNSMSIAYYADKHPTDTNLTNEGRAKNRRVEVKVLQYRVDSVEEALTAGRDLMDHGSPRTAAQIFEGALELDPTDPEARSLVQESMRRDAKLNGMETDDGDLNGTNSKEPAPNPSGDAPVPGTSTPSPSAAPATQTAPEGPGPVGTPSGPVPAGTPVPSETPHP
jgi:flagellar motor protein MotB